MRVIRNKDKKVQKTEVKCNVGRHARKHNQSLLCMQLYRVLSHYYFTAFFIFLTFDKPYSFVCTCHLLL